MAKRFRQNGENMDILNEAKKNFDYMVRIRRHMHEYPENSGVEYETVKYIASELDALGIEYVVVPEGGIIGQIHGGKPGYGRTSDQGEQDKPHKGKGLHLQERWNLPRLRT